MSSSEESPPSFMPPTDRLVPEDADDERFPLASSLGRASGNLFWRSVVSACTTRWGGALGTIGLRNREAGNISSMPRSHSGCCWIASWIGVFWNPGPAPPCCCWRRSRADNSLEPGTSAPPKPPGMRLTPAASFWANCNRFWYDRSLFPPGMSSSVPSSGAFDMLEYCFLLVPSPHSPITSNTLTVLPRPLTMSELVLYPSFRISCSARVDFCTPTVARLSDSPTREPVDTSSMSGPNKAARRFRSIAIAASILAGSAMLHSSSHSRVMSHKAST
mmetsp:Transcript_17249/g.39658  ORF Transcript_17249/g.39658 Transcript_17249/m.39658 type:complete len:275 (+) Transcript_17249:253-1077(+)